MVTVSVAAAWTCRGTPHIPPTCLSASQVRSAWRHLLTAADENGELRDRSTFRFDVVDVGRQVLSTCVFLLQTPIPTPCVKVTLRPAIAGTGACSSTLYMAPAYLIGPTFGDRHDC